MTLRMWALRIGMAVISHSDGPRIERAALRFGKGAVVNATALQRYE